MAKMNFVFLFYNPVHWTKVISASCLEVFRISRIIPEFGVLTRMSPEYPKFSKVLNPYAAGCLLIWPIQKCLNPWQKGTYLRVLQYIPIRQGLEGFQISLWPCVLNVSMLSIEMVKPHI